MRCLICESEKISSYLFVDGYLIKRCLSCGHGVTSPFPTPEELRKLYNKRYFSTHYETVQKGSNKFKRIIRSQRHRVRFVKRHVQQGTLLDVGCGTGYFLYACKKKFDCYGFDVTEVNRKNIEDVLEIKFFFNNMQEINQKFDVITLWHSLEHFQAPFETLENMKKILKSNGKLIIEVPNYWSIDGVMMHQDWPNWDPPFHLHHFTKKSLYKLAAKANLRIIDSHSYLSEYVKNRLKENLFSKLIARRVARMFAGSSIAIVLEK